jgi:hypothetical protein
VIYAADSLIGQSVFEEGEAELVEQRESWGWVFDNDSGNLNWKLANTLDEALAKSKEMALRIMCSSGAHSAYQVLAYARKLAELGRSDDLGFDTLDQSPLHHLPSPKYAIGDEYLFRSDADKAYFRKCLLKQQICQYRFGAALTRGYRQPAVVNTGRLSAQSKGLILTAMQVFDSAYAVEVAGIVASHYSVKVTTPCSLGGIDGALDGTRLRYHLLFRSLVAEKQKVLLTKTTAC